MNSFYSNKHLAPIDLIKAHYSSPGVVKSYEIVGLWPSEEKLIDKFFDSAGPLLDLGCGAGRTSIALAKKGYDVTAIDLIPEMIESAKRQAESSDLKINFKAINAVDLDFSSESFQNIFFSFNGFEQIAGRKNREKIIRSVWDMLKPGGCFILTSRSGLAIGRRSIALVVMTFKYLFQKLNIDKKKNLEFGDKVWKGSYHHYINPFLLRTLLRNIGFKVIYFNSLTNIDKGNESNFFANFSHDKSLFYVLKKERNERGF